MLSSGIPNLNLLFEDDFGIAVCHEWEGKYVIHSEVYGDKPLTFSDLKEVKQRSLAIDNAYRERGVKELYTWAETTDQQNYNAFLGYKPTGKTVNASFMDKDYPHLVYEYKKEL